MSPNSSVVTHGATMLRVFLSDSRRDREIAQRITDVLSEHDIATWTDWADIPLSAEWLNEILGAIENSHAFVFVVSPESASSRVCAIEASHAIRHSKRIVVALRQPADLQELPERLAQIQWIPFDDDGRFAESMLSMRQAIETDVDWLRRHTNLTILASLWERRGRDPGSLLRGEPLAEAERWTRQRDEATKPAPSPLLAEFIEVSRRQADVTEAENAVFAGTGDAPPATRSWRERSSGRCRAPSRAPRSRFAGRAHRALAAGIAHARIDYLVRGSSRQCGSARVDPGLGRLPRVWNRVS